MGTTKIEWAEKVWNPSSGCTKVSAGCANCYAARMAKRLAGRCGYPADDPFRVTLHPERLGEPLKWRKPSRIFVCSMGDLFHYEVTTDFIEAVFGIMSLCPNHTFIVLTKRPEQAKAFFENRTLQECRRQLAWYFDDGVGPTDKEITAPCGNWPLPNVWLGVTAENQEQSDKRIPILLQIPATVRFVSVEPMLGPVDLDNIQVDKYTRLNALEGCGISEKSPCQSIPNIQCNKLDWVICGSESGPKRRVTDIEWIRDLRDQCINSNTPFLLKQMEIDGKLIKMPSLDGKIYDQYPGGNHGA